MTQRILRPNPAMLHLARQLADTQRRLREIETASQAGFTSVEGRTLDFYDPVADQLLGSIGLQPDGSFGFNHAGGAKPETPTDPDVQLIPGGAIVAWDGKFEDAQSMLMIDRIAVHMDETPGFTPTEDTEYAAIYGPSGGTAVLPVDDGTDWYVKLVAVSKGGVWSDPSTEMHLESMDAETAFYAEEFTLTIDGAQDLPLTYWPLAFSDHLYLNGVEYDYDDGWDLDENNKIASLLTDLDARAGDQVTMKYAYRLTADDVIVPFSTPGWRYKQIAIDNATDYSAASYDDTAWATGATAFGHNGDGTTRTVATAWATNTRLWVRRTLPAATELTLQVQIEDNCRIYLNETPIQTIASDSWDGSTSGGITVVVPASSINRDGSNVLAICADDEIAAASDGPTDNTWFDVQVEGVLA